ncbi:MAG: hypothetical protein JWQ22_1806 [Devosia sp.]|nr:hypothetical protein [Devosia sp.]
MDLEFDADKDAINIAKHQISLARASELAIEYFEPDLRYDYGESRFRAWGTIDGNTYFLAFALRENRMRPISLRRVHRKEWERYVKP